MGKIIVTKKYLVIGYGNTLRGDDGLGPYIAKSLNDMIGQDGVDIHTLTVPQLDVILVSQISKADIVIFVDARVDDSEELVKVERIEPLSGPLPLFHSSHTMTIPVLLSFALDWYEAKLIGYVVMPKGYDFSINEAISEKARIAAELAKDKIIGIIESHKSLPVL